MANLLSTTVNGSLNVQGSSMYVTASQLHIGKASSGTAQMSFESWGSYTGAIAMNSSGAFHWGGQGNSEWYFKKNNTYNGDYSASGTTVLRIASDGNIWSAYYSDWLSNVLAGKVSTSGGSTIAGTTYFSGGESMQVYGIRGRFANEYIHLYHKVGIGNPNGWGEGQGSTPGYGLSTYGGAVFAYGNNATSQFYGHLRIDRNWGNGDYGAEQFTIRGTYPSIALRSTNHNSKWLIHNADRLQFYYGGTVDDNNWSNKFEIPTDGNIWMAWAGDYISNLLGAKQNASTAITTSNIGSQSVSYASNSGALGGLGVGSFLRDDGWNTYPGQDANTQGEMRVDFTYSNNAPYTGELIRFGSSGYSTQFNTSYGNSDNFAFRTRNGDNGTWNTWNAVIHSGNIGSQSVSVARQLLSPNNATVVAADSAMPSAGHSFIHTLAQGPGGNDGHILGMTWAGTTSIYGAQIFLDTDPTDTMAIRSRSSTGVWTSWKTVIHSGNIGSQSVSYATNAGSADEIDGWGFRNTGSNDGVNADNLSSNGITYYNAGVSNFSGNATDGALYSQAYSSSWQHQIAGDYRSGQIALRGRNNGTWQDWRTVLDDKNIGSYAVPYGNMTSSTGLNDNKLYLRTNGDNNHYLWNAADDWEEMVYYSGTGFRIKGSTGTVPAYFNESGVYASAYRGKDNVGGTGTASWHPDGIYVGSTQWLYGTQYRNGSTTSGQGWMYLDYNYGHSIVGLYSSYRYQGVFAMGDSYKLPADGTGVGNLYGMTWSHPNAGGVAGNLNTHGLLVLENGTFLAAISGSIRSRDDMRAPIFYDSQNTAYYLDPASGSNLNDVTANQFYANGWFRNYGTQGIYNQSYGTHFYSYSGSNWGITGSGGDIYLAFRSNHESTIRGYIHANTGNNIGFLNNGGSWNFRTTSDKNAFVHGQTLTINADNAGWSSIFMNDGDEGAREIHCNSNRIGFLTQAGSWGSWCDDDGGWNSVGNISGNYLYSNYSVRVGEIWGFGGLYRSSGAMLFGTENAGWSFRSGNSEKVYIATDGNIYMAWAGAYISTLLDAKQNASTAINTGNIGSQSVNYATSAGSSSSSSRSSALDIVGYGNGNMTYYQSSGTFAGQSGWAGYFISNHGDGATYYNQTIIMPFWGAPQYSRLQGGTFVGPYTFWSTENLNDYAPNMNQYVRTSDNVTFNTTTAPTILVNNHSDNTKGYRIHNTSGSSVSAMFTNSSNQLVIAAGAVDQINLNKKVYVNGVALGVNVSPSATAGRIDASNDIVAYSSSDERLKYNITPIENAIDKVKSLTGVEFDWKPEYKHAHGYEGHDTGIIAQQVQEVIPSAVRTNDTGFLAVRYEKLIGLLIEANKELAARVEELEKKLG